MVSGVELNGYRMRELVDNHILPLYFVLRKKGDMTITLREAQVHRYIAQILNKGNFSNSEIAGLLDIEEREVKKLSHFKPTKGFISALDLLKNPMLLLSKCDEYAYEYVLKKRTIERLIIEDLSRAKWTTRQIRRATGFGERRIQRLRKKAMEYDNE